MHYIKIKPTTSHYKLQKHDKFANKELLSRNLISKCKSVRGESVSCACRGRHSLRDKRGGVVGGAGASSIYRFDFGIVNQHNK